jgi:hypothetical protein
LAKFGRNVQQKRILNKKKKRNNNNNIIIEVELLHQLVRREAGLDEYGSEQAIGKP